MADVVYSGKFEQTVPVLKVGENVDATHGLIFKTFAHKGSIDSGIHMLCPNTSLN